jgi:hypothetical protein
MYTQHRRSGGLTIKQVGVSADLPVLSNAGIIVIAVLLASFILSLFAMWKSTLNSFAMMKVGAAVAPEVPFLLGYHEDKIDILDSTLGWAGIPPRT